MFKKFALPTLALCTIVACGPSEGQPRELDRAEDTRSLQQALKNQLGDAAGSVVFLGESELLAAGGCTVAAPTVEPGAPEGQEPCEITTDYKSDVDQMVDGLGSLLFSQENIDVSASTDTKIVYRLNVQEICASEEGADAECVSTLNKYGVSAAVTSTSPDVFSIDFIVSGDVIFELDIDADGQGEDFIAVAVDLGVAKSLYETLAADIPQEMGDAEIKLAALSGKVQLKLSNMGPDHIKVLTSVLEPLAVSLQQEGKEIFGLDVAKTAQAFEIELDGKAKTAHQRLDWGQVQVRFPAAAFMGGDEPSIECDDMGECTEIEPAAAPEGAMALTIPGLAYDIAFNGADERVELSALTFGQGGLNLAYDGRDPLLSAELKTEGAFPMILEGLADDGFSLSMKTGMEANLGLHFDRAMELFEEEVPEWAKNDVTSIKLDGAQDIKVEFVDEVARVVSGRLTLSSNALEAPIVIEANQCLIGEASEPPPEPVAPGDGEEPPPIEEPPAESSAHPFSSLSPQMCPAS